MKKKSRSFIYFLISLLSIIIVLIIAVSIYISNALELKDYNEDTIVTISGSNDEVLNTLLEENIIKDKNVIKLYINLFKKDTNFKKGSYKLSKGLNLNRLLEYLSDEDNIINLDNTTTITFIEGDWLKHFARKISENTNLEYDELINYWSDREVFNELAKEYPFLTSEALNDNVKMVLEGYLAPDTYEFFKETTKEAVTRKILDQSLNIYNEIKNDIASSNLSTHQIYTLASIIQYESGDHNDMPMISSVFHNRLNIGMKLESSVTRCYVINKEREDNWRDCEYDLSYNDPYDTYQNEGLPPGPILNPGIDALKAALNPSQSDYLFFVGDLEKHTYFARTLAEHEHNYCKYVSKECE